VPRAGPLRYWSLTLLGLAVLLVSVAALIWGTVNLIGTDSCGTQTTHECSSETGLHIVAVVLAPFAIGFGGVLLAFRGGGTMRPWRREKRVADMVARGEMAVPTVARPSMPAPALPDGPPATWQPAAPEPAEQSPIARLQQLDKMKAKGLISTADYESQKKRILGGT
jgi:putative oligomerization/nucleic acid binding protein